MILDATAEAWRKVLEKKGGGLFSKEPLFVLERALTLWLSSKSPSAAFRKF